MSAEKAEKLNNKKKVETCEVGVSRGISKGGKNICL
jgi:hypothetical protein